jgi:hypothetical protein
MFFEIKNNDCFELKDFNWIHDLTFSFVGTGHLSPFNINLQAKNIRIISLYDKNVCYHKENQT